MNSGAASWNYIPGLRVNFLAFLPLREVLKISVFYTKWKISLFLRRGNFLSLEKREESVLDRIFILFHYFLLLKEVISNKSIFCMFLASFKMNKQNGLKKTSLE